MKLLNGLMGQLRVVHAVALRETRTRFGAHKAGYLWAFVEPGFWIATFAGMYFLVQRHVPDGMRVIPFLTTGVLTFQIFSKTLERTASAINANRALLFYPQVQPLDLVIARTALELATYIVVFAVIVGADALLQGELDVQSVLLAGAGFLMASLLGMTFGLVNCAVGVVWNAVDRIRGPLMRPLFWMSGIFYTANELPTFAQELLLWNPVLHCVEIVRTGWFPAYHSHGASGAYVVGWIVVFAYVGLTLERAVRKKVQLT